MSDITLYQMAEAYRALLDTEADEEALAVLSGLDGAIRIKSEGIVRAMRHLEYMATAQENELADLSERAKRNRARVEWLKEYVKNQMAILELDEIDAGPFRLRIVTNPPAVQVDDASRIASEYQRTKIEVSVDKRGILDHYKSTGEIPEGVSITRGQSLRIS